MSITKTNADEFISFIRKVTGTSSGSILPLSEPRFIGRELEYVKECIDTNWVSSEGAFVKKFEQQLADFTEVPYAVAVTNGTAALHVALILAGVLRDDEVLTPTMTFIATTNAINYAGGIPHFVDSDEKSLGVSPDKLASYLREIVTMKGHEAYNKKTCRRIKALVVMHTFGHAVDMDPLIELCQRYSIELVEDAAEALGSYYKGKHLGGLTNIGTLSFNGNKTITTGGGGALLFHSQELAIKAKHITTTAKVHHAYEYYHDQVGYNYRLPNLNAALGVAQLEYIDKLISDKRGLAQQYLAADNVLSFGKIYKEPDFSKSNYWLNCFILNPGSSRYDRDTLIKACIQDKIFARPLWNLQHTLPMYNSCPMMDLSTSQDMENRIINIPSSYFLGHSNV